MTRGPDKVFGPPYRVLVCGSRDFTDRSIIDEVLLGAYEMHSFGWLTIHVRPFVVVHGAAPGADAFAGEWARTTGPHPGADYGQDHAPPVIEEPHPADWKKLGKGAGPIRNNEMLASGLSVVYAFTNKPLLDSKGTADMVRRCRRAGVKTYVIFAPHAVPTKPRPEQQAIIGL